EYEKYYRDFLGESGFSNTTLIQTANVLGVRESRRIIGDIVMNYEHYLARQVFEDEIGRYSYPIDIHPETADHKGAVEFTKNVSKQYGEGESYGISYRALTPKGLENVLVAGRCISADRSMQASMRVIPCCYITGQATGIAAALATSGGDVHNINITELQKRLVEFGAYLPNFK
ncbi:MAG: FAD-dependent oxidoreductase, partial [Clostridia bacterium]|nr:FAD-dependent oxidoreductase [Clostridia bacterium]